MATSLKLRAPGSMTRSAARPLRRAGPARRSAVVVRAELPRWPVMFQALQEKKLATITPEEAKTRVDSGEWILVDVRLASQYELGHPEGATSAPMYETIDITGGDLRRAFKALVYKSNGVTPVDLNPNFSELVKAAAAGGKGVITMCEAGGTLKPSVNFPEGKPSRSLQAAYKVVTEGLAPKVAHLERGVYGWFQAGLPMDGEYTPDIGRTPMAAAEPTLKRISQETGYEMRPEDKPVESGKKGWFW